MGAAVRIQTSHDRWITQVANAQALVLACCLLSLDCAIVATSASAGLIKPKNAAVIAAVLTDLRVLRCMPLRSFPPRPSRVQSVDVADRGCDVCLTICQTYVAYCPDWLMTRSPLNSVPITPDRADTSAD